MTEQARLTGELAVGGVGAGTPVAIVHAAGSGVALAWAGGTARVRAVSPEEAVAALLGVADLEPRWTWWSARESVGALVAAGFRPRACWDLGAVGRMLHGLRRADPAAVWAAQRGLPEPPVGRADLDLLDLAGEDGAPVRPDGQLSRDWLGGRGAADLDAAVVWAGLALALQAEQSAAVAGLPDPRPAEPRRTTSLATLNAYAESAAALLGVELELDGLPLDRAALEGLLADLVGPRPRDGDDELRLRAIRDAEVLQHFAGDPVDLRSPLAVRALLLRAGIDVPDTRSWRLEPYAASSPAVAALLGWRKAERLATTYGYAWADRSISGGRLRGAWSSADGGAGRMTAQAGLHNLPAELRPAVRAEPGMVLVRGDLGQVEPRVLAVISGDTGLAAAAREPDMYAPVAARLGCDRPTAKVAVLAAMYGQTSGPAGEALKQMDRAYPAAMAYLREAEAAGLAGTDRRTYGGRLLPGSGVPGSQSTGRYIRNAVVQGAAAELFKAWAATVRSALASGASGADRTAGIVLCLHDELLLHVPAEDAETAGQLLVAALDATTGWWAAGAVRFVVEVAVGSSWAAAH